MKFKKINNLENFPQKCCILASFGNLWRHVDAWFSQKCLLTKFLFSPVIKSCVFSYKLYTLVNTFLISAKCKIQSVSEVFFCNKDSESRCFQFDQGSYPRLSQSNHHGLLGFWSGTQPSWTSGSVICWQVPGISSHFQSFAAVSSHFQTQPAIASHFQTIPSRFQPYRSNLRQFQPAINSTILAFQPFPAMSSHYSIQTAKR